MNDNIKKAVVDTLGRDNEERRFYVYALCEKKNDKCIPFYIGKGQGERVWQHEIETEKIFETLKEEAENAESGQDNTVSEERENRFNDKHNEIQKLISEGKYERKIIKWGLTENEAFMVESALINFIGFENLTNLVNGHASDKEKNSNIHTTRSMTIDEFYGVCCKAPINFDDIKEKWMFININKLYAPSLTNEQICDITRASWQTSCEPDYLFAIYQSRIVGVFRCKKRIKICDMTEEDRKLFPKCFEDDLKNYKQDENFQNRSFYECELLNQKDELFEGFTVGSLLNRGIITNNNKSIFVQNPIRIPKLRIYSKASVNASRLEKELLKYFLKVEIKNCDENECLRRIDKKAITSNYTEKSKEKDKVNIKEFFRLLDYTVEKKEEPEILAKDIYTLVIQKSRKALNECIKDNQ